jgi:hypothetical protein
MIFLFGKRDFLRNIFLKTKIRYSTESLQQPQNLIPRQIIKAWILFCRPKTTLLKLKRK